ncbi:MAG: hypothetical protein QY306_06555 [Anaerolineales bacterium]|nr:MAG: hypothetical protein QY306_06555 [Anaerolineales bacterium]
MKSTSVLQIVSLVSLFLVACLASTLPDFSTQTPSPTLASIPQVPTLSFASTPAPEQPSAGLENENLLAAVPPGFKIDYQAENEDLIAAEMVAENESVNDWTTLVTVQTFKGTQNTPKQFQENLTQLWFDSCPNSESYPVADGVENGYNFVLWMLYCPLNPSTQKMEYAYIKAIQGNDSFYDVQVAFRYEPSDEDITYWMNYLKEVVVCDTRIAEQACP